MSPDFLNKLIHYGSGILAFLGVAYLYDKYKQKEQENEYYENQNIIHNYLLNDKFNGEKPFLWIPLVHQHNSRQWDNFHSRTSTRLNQPYIQATVKSIIQTCSRDFNICILDDSSYEKLVPNWTTDITQLPEPIRTHMRNLVQMRLLYTYGGLIVPPSFLCIKSLRDAYLQCSPLVAFEDINRGSSSTYTVFTPSSSFYGCIPNCKQMLDGIQYFEKLVSRNHTDELMFWDEWSRWLEKQHQENSLTLIDGETIGVKRGCKDQIGKSQREKREISIEEMLSERNGYHLFNQIQYGILIPQNQILKRTNYQWFARMSVEQIKNSNLAISDYFALCG